MVCNPSDCLSSERCILAYLYDAYTSCSYLRVSTCVLCNVCSRCVVICVTRPTVRPQRSVSWHTCMMPTHPVAIWGWVHVCSTCVVMVCNPSDCSSSEKCILAYLYDAYTSCSYAEGEYTCVLHMYCIDAVRVSFMDIYLMFTEVKDVPSVNLLNLNY